MSPLLVVALAGCAPSAQPPSAVSSAAKPSPTTSSTGTPGAVAKFLRATRVDAKALSALSDTEIVDRGVSTCRSMDQGTTPEDIQASIDVDVQLGTPFPAGEAERALAADAVLYICPEYRTEFASATP